MFETSILKIIRAAFDAIDRIASSVTAACVFAALVGPALQGSDRGLIVAGVAGVIAFLIALLAGSTKVMLDSLITQLESEGGNT